MSIPKDVNLKENHLTGKDVLIDNTSLGGMEEKKFWKI